MLRRKSLVVRARFANCRHRSPRGWPPIRHDDLSRGSWSSRVLHPLDVLIQFTKCADRCRCFSGGQDLDTPGTSHRGFFYGRNNTTGSPLSGELSSFWSSFSLLFKGWCQISNVISSETEEDRWSSPIFEIRFTILTNSLELNLSSFGIFNSVELYY